MISIDTNVLVRVLIDDGSKDQIQKARELVSSVSQIFIPKLVQVELIWVLARSYSLNKQEILVVLEALIENAAFHLEDYAGFVNALSLFRSKSTDFSDCLILASAKKHDATPVYTFDKKFARLDSVKNLGD